MPVLAITFGSGGACAAIQGQIGCHSNGMTILASNTLTGLASASGHAIDAPNRFGYISDVTNNTITKYSLDTLAIVGSPLSLGSSEFQPEGLAIDQPNNKLYVGLRSSISGPDNDHKAKVGLIDLGSFTLTSVEALNNNSGSQVVGIDIDQSGQFIYASSSTSSATINVFKISIPAFGTSTFTAGTLNSGSALYSGVSYDSTQNVIYVSDNINNNLYKVSSSLSPIASGGIYGGQLAFDTTNLVGYFASLTDLYKTSLTSFVPVQFTAPGGVSLIYTVGIDPILGNVYYSTNQSPSIIGSVNLMNFTNAGTLTLNSGQNGSLNINRAQIDTIYHVLYHVTTTNPAMVVKIQL